VQRYRDALDELRASGKNVAMLALTGVPLVSEYDITPPYQPIDGGLGDLVYRGWHESDLSAAEMADGDMPEDLYFAFTIGPACGFAEGALTRALPSPRLFDTCASLDGDAHVGCCIDSICGEFDGAFHCLAGVIDHPE
jgi:hypothetical protein